MGKEYDKYIDPLIFEGEYLNNEKCNGKEYNDRDSFLIFDDEYLNNWKWDGKEYQKNGELIFESEYSGDKRNDKGKHIIIIEI